MRFSVCKKNELLPGQKREIKVNNRRIVLCCTDESSYYAVSAFCPHQGAKMEAGVLAGTTIQSQVGLYQFGRCNEILRCPWHGYEFDVQNGRALFVTETMNLKSYKVTVEDDQVFIDL